MPLLGFGTFQIADGDVCEQSVLHALEAGYRLIDTARFYKNEQSVGSAIAKSGVPRSEIFIVTKLWFKEYENAREAVMDSLRNLGTDYLDMVLLHWPYGNCYAAWRELEKMVGEGIIRSIGVSNFEPDRLVDLTNFNRIVPAVNQIETDLFCQRLREREWMDRLGVRHMSYSPLGRGRRNEMFTLPEVLGPAQKYGKTAAQIMIRYQMDCGIVVIPKSTHRERIFENFDVLDFHLTPEELAALKAVDKAMPITGVPADPQRALNMMNY